MSPRIWFGLMALAPLTLAGCQQAATSPERPATSDNGTAVTPAPAPATPSASAPAQPPSTQPATTLTPPAPGEPGGLPDDRTPVAEGKIDPKSAQGAAQRLERYAALLEQGKYGEAYDLWSDSGKASGMSREAFVESFAKYDEIHSLVGGPAEMEGAAGSSYVTVPLQLYGRLKAGGTFNMVGPVTLRRVNDVPGATPAQLEWHIAQSDLKPGGTVKEIPAR